MFRYEAVETNVGGSELVLEFSAKKGKRVLIASTSEYGKSAKIPFNEDDDLGPTSKARWSYACSKMAEQSSWPWPTTGSTSSPSSPSPVRLFNTVGPRQQLYGMVLPTFVQQALAGEPITVASEPRSRRRLLRICRRHYSWTDDVHRFRQNRGRGVFNLGNVEEVSMNMLAQRIIAATGSKSEIPRVPTRMRTHRASKIWSVAFLTSPKHGTGSDSNPTHSLADILSSVIDYYRAKAVGDEASSLRLRSPPLRIIGTVCGSVTRPSQERRQQSKARRFSAIGDRALATGNPRSTVLS